MLKAQNIHKTYSDSGRELHVLRGIDLTVKESDIITIVGPSGAGKSTLLHILGGLDHPTQGTVTLEGEDVYRLNETKRSEIRNIKVGFIFQFYHLLPEFTALENVILPALVKNQTSGDNDLKTKGMALLERVGLQERFSHKPNQLSGGEQQRVAIARALINQPKVVFCDEPTGNLDSESGSGIVDLLMELNSKNKQTLVIVTHDENIANVSHSVIRMRDGKI